MIIGICGKSGSGKSTLSSIFVAKKNAIHIDIDKIGHFVLTFDDVKKELIEAFGIDIMIDDKVSRKKLGQIVFNSKEKMNKLTDITWKYMQIEIDRVIENNNGKVIILDWLLLPKVKYFKMCDKKILLDIANNIRMKRAIQRDEITKKQFLLRDNAGINYNEDDFDYVIKNSDRRYLEKMVNLL